jgi:hypothetical protein
VTAESQQFGPSAVLTPANAITIVRILLAPVAFWLIVERQSSWGLFFLWFLITTSDSLDGWLARRQGTTRSGAFLDPLADKVLALGGLWAMVVAGRFWWFPVAPGAGRARVGGRQGEDLPAVRGHGLGGLALDDRHRVARRQLPVDLRGGRLGERGAVHPRRLAGHLALGQPPLTAITGGVGCRPCGSTSLP